MRVSESWPQLYKGGCLYSHSAEDKPAAEQSKGKSWDLNPAPPGAQPGAASYYTAAPHSLERTEAQGLSSLFPHLLPPPVLLHVLIQMKSGSNDYQSHTGEQRLAKGCTCHPGGVAQAPVSWEGRESRADGRCWKPSALGVISLSLLAPTSVPVQVPARGEEREGQP